MPFHILSNRPTGRFRLGFILILYFISNTSAFCQIDSLLIAPFKEKKSFTYGINNRRTSLFNQNSTIYGIFMGIQYGERMKHVITMNSNICWAGQEDQVRLTYAGFAEEFKFLSVKRFEFISYIHGGLGVATYRQLNSGGQYQTHREVVSPLELGVHLSYQLLDWLQLKGGVGYRFVLLTETQELDNVYYKVGLNVDIRKLRAALESK